MNRSFRHILDNLLGAGLFVLAAIGAATVIVACTQSCSAQNHTEYNIEDMTQADIDTLVENNENLNDMLNMAIHQLDAYRDYYLSVEHMLDAAGINNDSPVIETDAGSDYLQFKYIVDSLEEHNKWAQPAKK